MAGEATREADRGGAAGRPAVVVLTGADEPLPPGLEPLSAEARVLHANDAASLEAALPEAEILVVTDFRTGLVEKAWPRAERLRWVHATSAGVDALLFPGLVESEVPLTNASGIFDRSIAEYVLGAILLFAKDFHGSLALQHEHQWRHRDVERVEGTRALVVGAGGIGRATGRLLRGAGLAVEGIARRPREIDPELDTIHASERLHERLPHADWVVIAAPLTSETRGLFGREAFRAMKGSARLVNVGRGPIVDTDALVEALRSEQIGGAVLDVFEEEPLPADHPLWSLPHVVVTAHMAGDFRGWRRALSEQFLENFRRYQSGEALRNRVDKRRGYVPGRGSAT